MEKCLDLARDGAARGEVPVGALVLSPAGEILGEGVNLVEKRRDPTAHAEIVAIRRACAKAKNSRLEGCVLVTTLEPCAMCAGAIINARLCGVVFGASDAQAGAIVSRAEFIAALPGGHNWYMGGVRAAKCAEILENFFRERR